MTGSRVAPVERERVLGSCAAEGRASAPSARADGRGSDPSIGAPSSSLPARLGFGIAEAADLSLPTAAVEQTERPLQPAFQPA
jgi:hypothetical protein